MKLPKYKILTVEQRGWNSCWNGVESLPLAILSKNRNKSYHHLVNCLFPIRPFKGLPVQGRASSGYPMASPRLCQELLRSVESQTLAQGMEWHAMHARPWHRAIRPLSFIIFSGVRPARLFSVETLPFLFRRQFAAKKKISRLNFLPFLVLSEFNSTGAPGLY